MDKNKLKKPGCQRRQLMEERFFKLNGFYYSLTKTFPSSGGPEG